MPLKSDEEIVRAICTDKWDGERISPSAFIGPDTSVSRLAIIPLEEHWDLFRRGVEKPPERLLKRIAQISVGKLEAIGKTHNPPVGIEVEPEPLDWNPAHAIIPGKRSRGLANRIRDCVTIHRPPSEF
jgi:hypothetical protein